MKEFLRWNVDIPDDGDALDADEVRLSEKCGIESIELTLRYLHGI